MKRKRQTCADIAAFCGIFRQPPGAKSVIAEHLEERVAERRREDTQWERGSAEPPPNAVPGRDAWPTRPQSHNLTHRLWTFKSSSLKRLQ